MKGYLLKEKDIVIGEPYFCEVRSAESAYTVAFEDDGETGYFYAGESDQETGAWKIFDMVFIYDVDSVPKDQRKVKLSIVWSTDWQRCALVLGNTCHAIFDFENHGGYNLAEFPEPNNTWTQHERKLTAEMVREFF